MKNAWGKTRKQDNPYFTSTDVRAGWTWKILKAYQSSAAARKNPYARVFCAVSSPMTMGGVDLGDVYVKDIPGYTFMLDEQHKQEMILHDVALRVASTQE